VIRVFSSPPHLRWGLAPGPYSASLRSRASRAGGCLLQLLFELGFVGSTTTPSTTGRHARMDAAGHLHQRNLHQRESTKGYVAAACSMISLPPGGTAALLHCRCTSSNSKQTPRLSYNPRSPPTPPPQPQHNRATRSARAARGPSPPATP